MQIPSSYFVGIKTDIEIGQRQLEKIVEDVRNTADSHSEATFVLSDASAELDFIKASTSGKTLPIVSTRGIISFDVPKLRKLVRSRIDDARGQVRVSGLVNVIALDMSRADFFGDMIDDIFCGTEQWQLDPSGMRTFRLKDGIIHENGTFDNVDAILVV
jgi:hypothetical protein